MLNCVIIDDEPLALEVLTGYLALFDDVILIASFSNALDAIDFLKAHTVDALFLDIEMPEMSGIDLLKSLPQPPITVFTTAFRNYAFDGYELGVIDFLLKPISQARFQLALNKIRDFLTLKSENTDIEPQRDHPEYIFVKSGVQRIKLYFLDVMHIQGLKDYAIIHTAKGKIVIKGSIKTMQTIFPEDLFIRVHKSFIISKDKIKRIEKNRMLIGDQQIPIGRNYREEIERQILS